MINPECTSKIINNLDTSKATHQGHIPTKIIKDNKNLIHILLNNNAVNKDVFPDKLKHADTKPIYKTESRIEKEIYRPVSTLPNLPKIFELCMHDQLNDYFYKILSKYWCRFRKRFSTQHCLLAMIEKLRKRLDSRGLGWWDGGGVASAALLIDLSKTFD